MVFALLFALIAWVLILLLLVVFRWVMGLIAPGWARRRGEPGRPGRVRSS